MLWTDHKVKILSGLLLLSLAVNVGLVSFMAGRHTGRNLQGQRGNTFMSVLRDLPQDQRRAAAQILHKHRPALQQSLKALRDQRDTIRALAAKDKIDPKEMNDAFAELRRRMDKAAEEGQSLSLELLPGVPPAQRRALLEKQGKMMP
jgi:uncharacterized membrane protein